jgi:hypothetical protein
MKKNKKGLAVLGLLALCAILAAGIFTLGQSPRGEDALVKSNNPIGEASTGGIAENHVIIETPGFTDPHSIAVTHGVSEVPGIAIATDIAATEVNPAVIPQRDPDTDGQHGDIALTTIEGRPEPPELPDTAHKDHEHDESCGHELPSDPALTNPDAKPDTALAHVEPDKPKDNAPQSRDANGNGEIYIPGFGWVKNEGGGSQGRQSSSDGDWDKIIGH